MISLPRSGKSPTRLPGDPLGASTPIDRAGCVSKVMSVDDPIDLQHLVATRLRYSFEQLVRIRASRRHGILACDRAQDDGVTICALIAITPTERPAGRTANDCQTSLSKPLS